MSVQADCAGRPVTGCMGGGVKASKRGRRGNRKEPSIDGSSEQFCFEESKCNGIYFISSKSLCTKSNALSGKRTHLLYLLDRFRHNNWVSLI